MEDAEVKSFSELSGRAKAVEVLRWIGVFPAALLARLAFHTTVAAIYRTKAIAGGIVPDKSALVDWLQLWIFDPTPIAIFVVAGAIMAPRCRHTTAILLAALAIGLSLTIHVLLPESVGANNYKHFTAESAGAIAGVAFTFFLAAKSRCGIAPSDSDQT
jgi:hypothetical protein